MVQYITSMLQSSTEGVLFDNDSDLLIYLFLNIWWEAKLPEDYCVEMAADMRRKVTAVNVRTETTEAHRCQKAFINREEEKEIQLSQISNYYDLAHNNNTTLDCLHTEMI